MSKKTIKYKTRKTQEKLQRKQKKISSQKGGELNTFMSFKIFAGNMYNKLSSTVKNTYNTYNDRLNNIKQSTNNSIFGKISSFKNTFNKRVSCLTS
tara:strand:- start:3519 stop:3806 length:288 start_codon:yes stop_codon:yes gene_type:complete